MKEITEDKGRIRPVVEGDFQCDENGNSTRFYEILSIVGIVDNTTKLSYISKKNVPVGIPITNEEYWYPFQVIAVPKGDKGDDGKSAYDLYIEHGGTIATVEEWLESLHGADGISPILRISPDGLSIEISSDNGQTWLPFQKDFNKLRVLGYVDSIAELPASANIGDIYGVWNQQAQSGAGAYELYINTVKDWLLDYTITKVYDYDTELPSSATDGTAVLVPVTDLTLDKEKIDGYKVYRYSLTNNGWIMILNTAEIYANKTDIINYGDNIYALVQGATEGTYELYKRSVGWVQFGTNASITYHLIQNISDATSTNVLSGKAVKDAIEEEATTREEAVSEINQTIDNYKEEVKETYGDYIENPEFVRAVTDKDDKVLYGVQADGNFYFGAGCPQQVKDYVQQQIDTIIGVSDVTEKIDTINEMIAFFDEISHDTTLKELLAASAQAVAEEKTRAEAAEQHLAEVKANKEEVNAALDTKVDKEEGKSLIDAEYASSQSAIENPEFLEVTTDSEDKVLEGIQSDGTKVFGGDINVGGSANFKRDIRVFGNMEVSGVSYKIIDSPEYLAAWLDAEDKVVFGLKADGKTYVGDADFLNEIKNNKEAIGELKAVLGSISSSIESLDIDTLSSITAIENPEYLKVELDAEGKILSGTKTDGSHYVCNIQSETIDAKVDKEEGKSLINEEVAESKSAIEDPEGRSEITTDSEGKIISYRDSDGVKHESVGIETNHLGLSSNATQDLINALDALGYTANNPADWSDSEFVEIPIPSVCAVVNIEVDSQAEAKGVDIPTHIQFWDKSGNYFRKPIELNAQGSSSMSYHIKNQAIDFTDGSKLKFGNWIACDSFHIKKYFIDVFRGQCIVGYWLTEQMYQTRPYGERRPWDYLNSFNNVDGANGSFSKDYDTGALAHPDGFPVKVFFNGKNAGIYAFNLKKDRSNYYCKKDKQKQIILDGVLGDAFWGANGNLRKHGETGDTIWNDFEVRNPKISKDINGNKYDGDNPTEPSDDYATCKAAIERLTTAITLVNAESTTEAKKAKFEEFFNIPFFIDYDLIGQVIYNSDGYRKNWIWITNDGEKWCPTSYDMDSIFGQHWNGASYVQESISDILGTFDGLPTGSNLLKGLYQTEMRARYKELRDNEIFSVDNIIGLLEKWVNACGYNNLKEDIEEIVTSPYIENGNVVIDGEGKQVLIPNTPSYRDGTIDEYVYPPATGGWYNSILRVKNWLAQRLQTLDVYFNYNQN